MSDEPQIVRDWRRMHPRNAKPDAEGGNAAARRMWNGPEPMTCRVLGCSTLATTFARMQWQGADLEVPICDAHHRVLSAGELRNVSIGE